MKVLTAIIDADSIEAELQKNISEHRSEYLTGILDNISSIRRSCTDIIETSFADDSSWEEFYCKASGYELVRICGAYLERCIQSAEKTLREKGIPPDIIREATASASDNL